MSDCRRRRFSRYSVGLYSFSSELYSNNVWFGTFGFTIKKVGLNRHFNVIGVNLFVHARTHEPSHELGLRLQNPFFPTPYN